MPSWPRSRDLVHGRLHLRAVDLLEQARRERSRLFVLVAVDVLPETSQFAGGGTRHDDEIELGERGARRRRIVIAEGRLEPFERCPRRRRYQDLPGLGAGGRASVAQGINRAEHHGGASLDISEQIRKIRLPFATGAFDLVLSSYVVKHLDEDEIRSFFIEVYRVLAPGGLALIWDFAPTGSAQLDAWNRWVVSRGVGEPRFRSTRAVMALGELAGFEYVRAARLRPFLLPPIPRASVLVGKPPEGWRGR